MARDEVKLEVRLKKGRDGPDALTCTRPDGTSTWRRIQRGLALHDLAHFAVESELALGDGFFGLVARGWSFDALVAAEERARLPRQAIWVELLVNRFSLERLDDAPSDAQAFHAELVRSAAALGLGVPRELTDAELESIRALLSELAARWQALAPGETLELCFDVEPA